ncbi:hypothetical protein L218DRAFT_952094 [Marasmius fiardii PR-910]|nr:hypothetical protein L218DRAFT_952094 [Marasmius fiardii PR-910]
MATLASESEGCKKKWTRSNAKRFKESVLPVAKASTASPVPAQRLYQGIIHHRVITSITWKTVQTDLSTPTVVSSFHSTARRIIERTDDGMADSGLQKIPFNSITRSSSRTREGIQLSQMLTVGISRCGWLVECFAVFVGRFPSPVHKQIARKKMMALQVVSFRGTRQLVHSEDTRLMSVSKSGSYIVSDTQSIAKKK